MLLSRLVRNKSRHYRWLFRSSYHNKLPASALASSFGWLGITPQKILHNLLLLPHWHDSIYAFLLNDLRNKPNLLIWSSVTPSSSNNPPCIINTRPSNTWPKGRNSKEVWMWSNIALFLLLLMTNSHNEPYMSYFLHTSSSNPYRLLISACSWFPSSSECCCWHRTQTSVDVLIMSDSKSYHPHHVIRKCQLEAVH